MAQHGTIIHTVSESQSMHYDKNVAFTVGCYASLSTELEINTWAYTQVAAESRVALEGGPAFRAQSARWLMVSGTMTAAALHHTSLLAREMALGGIPAGAAAWMLLHQVGAQFDGTKALCTQHYVTLYIFRWFQSRIRYIIQHSCFSDRVGKSDLTLSLTCWGIAVQLHMPPFL